MIISLTKRLKLFAEWQDLRIMKWQQQDGSTKKNMKETLQQQVAQYGLGSLGALIQIMARLLKDVLALKIAYLSAR